MNIILDLYNKTITSYSPLVTNGVASDNEMKIFIHFGGLLGLLIYIFLIFALYKGIVKSSVTKFDKLFLLTLVISIVLVGLTNGFIMSNRIFPIFIIIYFLILTSNKYKLSPEVEKPSTNKAGIMTPLYVRGVKIQRIQKKELPL